MAQLVSASITRRSVVAGVALSVAPFAALAVVDSAYAAEKSLYDRLGGVFVIATVVNHFSDALVKNPVWAGNPKTRSCGNGTQRT